ncbi:MAG: CDP-glycerol glycerophosphotransferase family protein [Bacteroidales bacterium]|nr:CDP-glycerol glycerophosphotransferase family protein [Bacteroidales bacterium]
MTCFFDVQNIYYIPQYFPVWRELIKRGHTCKLVVYENTNKESLINQVLSQIGVDYVKVQGEEHAKELYLKEKPDWIFFGNKFGSLDLIHKHSKSIQMGHGIGPKRSYYRKSDTPMTVRFIEGEMRLKVIEEMYPDDNFVQVGFSKLDPVFDGTEAGIDLQKLGLDPEKPTILYAPTFNPTSIGCFPKDWPEDFKGYNILIKPHSFTFALTKSRYIKDQKRIKKWAEYPNVYLADADEYSLVPFLKTADILISEASSTLFEFAALDKPVVICDFYDLKWSYKGIFKYRFKKRFLTESVIYQDLGTHAENYKQVKQKVEEEMKDPSKYQSKRHQYNKDHVGPTDGKASVRIVDYLEKYGK